MKAETENVHGLAEQMRQIIAGQRPGFIRWNISSCSICSAPYGFVFWGAATRAQPAFSSACECADFGYQPRTWADVALHYIRHPAPAWWGFDSTSAADEADVATARAGLKERLGYYETEHKAIVAVAPELPRLPINGPELTAEQTAKRLQIRHVTFERTGPGAPWLATHITPRADA